MTAPPALTCFRIDTAPSGVLHLVFDLPGRSMNVFTNQAIHELGAFAAWLPSSDAPGVVVRSGKTSAFCAGADLGELGQAYDTIMARPRAERTRVAFDHFFPLSRAIRALETAGKPVAAAIAGLALGGGCELALGCHHRVVADGPKVALGLPESLVGLLPGGGGTQRLPRVAGVEAAMPILLEGGRFSPEGGCAAGLVHEVVAPGEEVAAAERWVLSGPDARQPWDRPDWRPEPDASAVVARRRERVMGETGGHYPAPLAILDCVEQGYGLPMDEAIRAEMTIFAGLIQRPEPRNMIRTLFVTKGEVEKLKAAGQVPPAVTSTVAAIDAAMAGRGGGQAAREAGFTKPVPTESAPAPASGPASGAPRDLGEGEESADLWFEGETLTGAQREGLRLLLDGVAAAARSGATLDETARRMADYLAVSDLGFPAYLGGPFALGRYLGRERYARLAKVASA